MTRRKLPYAEATPVLNTETLERFWGIRVFKEAGKPMWCIKNKTIFLHKTELEAKIEAKGITERLRASGETPPLVLA